MADWRRIPFAHRLMVALLGLVAVLCVPAMAMAERIALVVGNARYEHIPSLATPVEDTRAVAEALRRLGFKVTLLSDVSTDIFGAVLDAFARNAKDADAVLFWYSGHAFQEDGVNRLVPVEARLDSADAMMGETWSMDDIVTRIGGAGSTLIFLDACRTNPVPEALRGPGAAAQGLNEIDAGSGTFVSFSTRPGMVSYDQGSGPYSPFAQAFLANVESPGQSVSDLMIKVRKEVEVNTVGRQVPWDQSSLREQFYFAGQGSTAEAPAEGDGLVAPGADPALEALLGNVVIDTSQQIGPAPGAAPVDEASVVEPTTPPPTVPPPDAPLLPNLTLAATATGPIRLAAATDSRATIQAITGGRAARPGAVTSTTRTTEQSRLAPVMAASPAARVSGIPVLGIEPSPSLPAPTAPALVAPAPVASVPLVLAPAALAAPAPEDLARSLQDELKRVGCYRQTVDGDWGPGSRKSARRFFEARKAAFTDADLEPTEALLRSVSAATGEVCAAPPPTQTSTTKPTVRKPKDKKPPTKTAAPAPKPEPPPVKRKPTCKFVVVAVVCK